jgi:hypothetical protein
MQKVIYLALVCLTKDMFGQLSPEQLKKDVLELRSGLEKNHPGLYWYTSKKKFDSIWNNLNSKIDRPMSDLDFFKTLLQVVAQVKCAHTLFYPSKHIISKGKRFPLSLKFVGGKAYIMNDSAATGIPNGSELFSINGKSITDIIQQILPCLEAQGGNIGWKYAILENDFQNYYYYIVEREDKFTVQYVDRNTKQKVEEEIPGTSNEVLRTHWSKVYPKEDGAPITLTFKNDIAVIKIRSLNRGRYKMYSQDFEKTLAQSFKELRERAAKKLVIDVRGNEGGNNPDLVYSYIARSGDKNITGSSDFIKPAKDVFAGEVAVLMNERSISSQEIFAGIFMNNRRGLTIGRATPGSYDGLCGGNKRKIVLPNSHFEMQIPLHAAHWTFTDKRKELVGHGFSPDVPVDESIDDIVIGKDSILDVALKKLGEHEN